MDLPKNEKTFEFSHIGATTGNKYDGKFTVKCVLNMFDKREIELEKSRLQADVANPTNLLSSLSHILSNLRIRITKAPTWWEQSLGGFDLMDEDVVIALFDRVMEQEDAWHQELKALSAEGEPEGNPQKES